MKSGQWLSTNTSSVYASCQSRKFETRSSPEVRMSRSGIGHVGRVEVRGEDVLVDLPRLDAGLDELPRGLDDLGPPAVVERDPETESRVLGRLPLEARHLALQLLRGAVAASDEADSHALAHEVGELPVDRLAEDLHQRVDLVAGARPVLRREGVDGERLDVEVDRRLDRAAKRLRAGPVTLGDRQAAPAAPSGRCRP